MFEVRTYGLKDDKTPGSVSTVDALASADVVLAMLGVLMDEKYWGGVPTPGRGFTILVKDAGHGCALVELTRPALEVLAFYRELLPCAQAREEVVRLLEVGEAV